MSKSNVIASSLKKVDAMAAIIFTVSIALAGALTKIKPATTVDSF